MPVRRENTSACTVDPRRFQRDNGVGPDPYFREPGHATSVEARAHWALVRRDVWATCHRFRLPRAAEHYDGLSRTAWKLLWDSWANIKFNVAPVLEALTADERALARFESTDPDGARQIRDYLDLWRADLATVRALAVRCGAAANDWRGRLDLQVHGCINSAARYGDARDEGRRHDE